MTFEELIRAAADRGIRNLNVTKRTDGKGYEASAKRRDRDAYVVHVHQNLLAAIAFVLMEDGEFVEVAPSTYAAVAAAIVPVVSQEDIDELI